MKMLFIIVTMLLISCSSVFNALNANLNKSVPQYEMIKCRITYYCGLDKWGDRVACQKTKRAIYGTTVAAHPDFQFGQKIRIPSLNGIIGDGNFTVQDRGAAVTKKIAARGKTYVFDVYVKTQSEMNRLANALPMYMNVLIENNYEDTLH